MFCAALQIQAQVKIGDNVNSINSRSLLELESTDKGVLIPRMSKAQRDAITLSAPAEGMMVYQTDNTPGFYYNSSTTNTPSWTKLNTPWLNSGTKIYYSDSVGIGTAIPTEKLEVNGNIKIPATSNYKYAAAKTRYLNLPAAAFNLVLTPSSTVGIQPAIDGDGERYVRGGTTGVNAYFEAPVQLPEGAILQGIEMYARDLDPNNSISAILYSRPHGSFLYNQSSYGSTSGVSFSSGPILVNCASTGLSGSPIDGNNNYFIRVNTKENSYNLLYFYSVRIAYTVTQVD
jgi:hypothetical protein